MQDFRNLAVWKDAYSLALEVYRATRGFPTEELYGLTSQLRRCGISIPANIAEGCGRATDADFSRFLHIAMGSASELECHLLMAHDLGLLDQSNSQRLLADLAAARRKLNALIQRLKVPHS